MPKYLILLGCLYLSSLCAQNSDEFFVTLNEDLPKDKAVVGDEKNAEVQLYVSPPDANFRNCSVTASTEFDGSVTALVEISQYNPSGKKVKNMTYTFRLKKGYPTVRNVSMSMGATRCEAVSKKVSGIAREKTKKELEEELKERENQKQKLEGKIDGIKGGLGLPPKTEETELEK